jgi:hypothetical protein
MSDATITEPNGTPSPSTTAPKAKHGVPRGSLSDAETLAKAIWDAARLGAVPPEALAKELSGPEAKASGGAWRAKMALIRVFGLSEDDGQRIRLSTRGRQIVREDDPEGIRLARREAILAIPPYAEVLRGSAGLPMPSESSLSATFEFSYGLKAADARAAARDFIASTRLADLLTDDDVVMLETSAEEEPSADPAANIDLDLSDSAVRDEMPPSDEHRPDHSEDAVLHPKVTGAQQVALSITLDLSDFAPEDVIRILQSVGLSTNQSDEG